jgi:predicted Fe-Mo cluster-binding NifX family protein
VKIAFTTKGISWESMMDPRFGRTEYILVYDEENDSLSHFDNREINNEAHGAGPKTAKNLFDLGADVLLTGNGPGGNAAAVLEKAGTKIYIGAGEMNVHQALEAYRDGQLKKFVNS